MLDQKQTIQEDQYRFPYHWQLSYDTHDGRVYFGYLSECLSFLKGLSKDARILDAGCGDGRFLAELQKAGFTGIYGADYSQRAIAFAQLFVPAATTISADLNHLPYEDKFFDRVFLIETLEHIVPQEIPALMRELSRVLKDDGELIITVPSTGLPLADKHYQHFSPVSLTETVKPLFVPTSIIGQDRKGLKLIKLLYLAIDNRFLWTIWPLARFYNRHIWRKIFNRTKSESGRRLIARLKKNVEV